MAKLTPMMAQYKAIKEKYSDCIVMFRLGDFYEMFFEDAIEASKILQITLTSRNKNSDVKAPMCGIPYHAVEQYIPKLTRAGKKVAVCDQMTEPDGKSIVEREVVRVITPGTTFDENIIDKKTNNYIGSVVKNSHSKNLEDIKYGFAYADVTTGEFKTTELQNISGLYSEIQKIRPSEIICDENLIAEPEFKAIFKDTYVFPYNYIKEPESSLKKYFEIKSLEIFGLKGKIMAVQSAGMLFEYLRETQKTDLKHIRNIKYYEISEFMPLDEACIRNLELLFTSRENKREWSLIFTLDNTVCNMGGRLLRNWLLHPMLDKKKIEARLDKVEIFVKNSSLMRDLRENLAKIFDIERLLSRLTLGTGNGRDLIALKDSLKIVPKIKESIKDIQKMAEINKNLFELTTLVELIEKAIIDEAPISVKDGGIIKKGYNQELDDLRSISTEGKTFIKNLQEREIKRTKISSLKVRFNQVFGYYIEISKANLSAVPSDYIRKQTLVNAERFITPELKEYEEKVLNAEEKIKALEYELFYQVRMKVVEEIVKIQNISRAIAELDIYSAFGFNAEKFHYCKPEILETGEIKIDSGRHPVIERIKMAREFVPNDCEINKDRNFLLITGLNMGGKSTYLRQVALIVLMAHIGSYVPAQSAKISIIDRIFTRVGASDNLIAGESTFMVEMQEAAYILHNATDKSLIILDEVGRGTSTYDGVSIAWAIMEYIHDHIKAKTLFATHYHELIQLADKLPKALNLSVAVKESVEEGVVFLYKIVSGGIDKSYGIEVAKLAGLPIDIISRARGVIEELESRNIQKRRISPDQMGLFQTEAREHKNFKESQILKDIKNIDINKLTPLEALEKLNEIKRKSI